MGRLQDLVTEIEEGVMPGGWSIPVDVALRHLEEEAAVFYRYYYASGRSMADLPERFDNENVELLLGFLDDRGLPEARRVFQKKGWYISRDELLRWEEFFLSVSLSVLLSHTVQEDDLEIALSGCLDPADGLRFYCESHFSVDSLVNRVLRIYRPPAVLQQRLRRHIFEQFQRRLFREETIYAGLIHRLREYASLRGWLRDMPVMLSHLEEDLLLFGLNGPVDEAQLKVRYRERLKQVHPDVNRSPDAVKQTQRINEAYARLSEQLAGARI